MSYRLTLPAEYHQQDTNYYCGAACALMVLQHLGGGHLSQNVLYNDNHSHSLIEGGWATGPDGLEWTMNHYDPRNVGFDLLELNSEDAVSRAIAWSVHRGVSAIALVYGDKHWVTVLGFDASRAPSSNTDTGYQIQGVYIHNPWPPTPVDPATGAVPPHTTGDGCGRGGNYGIANEHISYATWQNDYMDGVPSGHWNGKYVAVCLLSNVAQGSGEEASGRDRAPQRPRRLISENEAERIALDSMSRGILKGASDRRDVASQAAQEKPILVKRLDRENDSYYLVPTGNRGSGAVQTVISVDAQLGTYRQSIFAESSLPFNYRPLEKERIMEKAITRNIISRDMADRLNEPDAMSSEMVWMPCLESFSPFWPFQRVIMGNQTVYIRIDGEVFLNLTTDIKGA